MEFDYSARGVTGRQAGLRRFLEILPGATSWTFLVGMTVLSFQRPVQAAVIIIAFDLYWLLRLFYGTFFLVMSYALLRAEETTDWMREIRALEDGDLRGISNRRRRNEARHLLESGSAIPACERIRHLVIIPVARETEEVVEPGIRGLCGQKFPPEKILVALTVEEHAPPETRQGALRLAEKYKGRFFDFLTVFHPEGLPGEARVKGANATWAAKKAAAYFEARQINFDDVIVSCFDADTVVSPQYFACLTYAFMVCPHRTRASFQPIPVYHNNIWEVPGFARVLETGSSFFLLIEATNTEKLVTFSSHSMSFRALVDVGYWPVDMVSDDSAIFWKAFIHFDGDYHTIPMYVTVSMDMVAARTWWETACRVYRQKRRWAWGVENFPLVAGAFLKKGTIPLYDRVRHAFKLFENHVSWATWAFLLTFIGWIPAFFSAKQFSNSVLYYSSQRITGAIFNLSLLSFVISIALSLLLLPKKRTRHPLLKRARFALEWIGVPFIATFLSALPALDTQTRLMLGRRLGFQVTDKRRRQS
ncbi:MAG: glycosyltransferase family 2 protein [Candidatus Omnitrophica bacterium]|nr:glycosyltransferase family 2 protein [Candidatus Omnitrophota bacterium]